MDLREKPGLIQSFGEFILRFRLIFVVVLACVCGYLFAGYTEILTFGMAMSESIGMKVAEGNLVTLWPWLLLLLPLLLPRFIVSGVQVGIAALVLAIAMPAGFFALQNTESLALPVLIALAVISFVLFIVLKHGFGCAAFPAFLSVVGFIGAMGGLNVSAYSRYEIAVYATLLACDLFGIALNTGKKLVSGEPKNGALLFGLRKQFLALLITPVLFSVFFFVRGLVLTPEAFGIHFALAAGYIVFFFFLSLPLLTFAPFARLRAKTREINVPKSTGVKK